MVIRQENKKFKMKNGANIPEFAKSKKKKVFWKSWQK